MANKIGSIYLRFRRNARLPMILQEELAECAHACIAMVAHFWGCKLSLSHLRRLYATSVRGITVLQMNKIFDQLGFKTRVLRIAVQDLPLVSTPAILHWNQNHFVVLNRVRRKKVLVHDPAIGVKAYTLDEAARFFSGIVLEIEQTERLISSSQSSSLTIWVLLKSMLGMSRIGGLLLLLSVFIELMQIINPMFMQYVTDYVVGANALGQMYHIGMGCVLFFILQGMTEWLRSHLILYTSIRITEALATEVFQHLLRLPLQFFAHRHVSDIQTKFQFIDQLKTKLSTDFMHAFLDGLMILVTIGVMYLYSSILACMIVSMMMLYASTLYWNIHTYRQQISAAVSLHAKTAVTFQEALRGIAPIKSFLKEQIWFQLWRNDYVDALNHDIRISQTQIRYRILNQVLGHIEYVLVICVGARLVLSQQMSIGMLLAFLAYRMILVNKFTAFVQYLFAYQTMTIQLQRLEDLLDQAPEVIQSVHQAPRQAQNVIHVQSICFSYPGSTHELLSNVNFSVHPGEKIAIIGPSGCGKTTLLKIMMGFESPSTGRIVVDDIPLSIFGLQHFRQISASVMQDDVLFTGSILDNITFFADEVDMSRVYKMAKLSCIHDTIVSLPMGYDSLISQTQTSLSGGQRQRILLARALYKQPQFLFLDEATSHLDLDLEKSINQALSNHPITQIMVAHRPETIAMADRVIELQ